MANESGFRQAAARFSAEVERALTRARRAVRDAKAESGEFRRTSAELAEQAKNGKLKGLRRGQVAPTNPEAREEATAFRTANGLPVPDLPAADEVAGQRSDRRPADDDFAEITVLFDVDNEPLEERPTQGGIDSPEPEVSRSSEPAEDFSQQRILMDATVETYRPDEIMGAVFDDDGPDNRR
jgi:hypothetical protein